MADVGGGGTGNVTLYDEEGRQLGHQATAPLHVRPVDVGPGIAAQDATVAAVRDRLADGSTRVVLHNALGSAANAIATDRQYQSAARTTDNARLAGSGRISLTLSGNLRSILINPATLDSGAANTTTIRLERVEWYTSSSGFGSVLTNVTGGIPTTPRRPKVNPRTLAQTTASSAGQPAILIADGTSTNFTGGNDTGIVVPLPTDRTVELDLPLTIAPGQNVALSATYGKGVDSVITFYWSNV